MTWSTKTLRMLAPALCLLAGCGGGASGEDGDQPGWIAEQPPGLVGLPTGSLDPSAGDAGEPTPVPSTPSTPAPSTPSTPSPSTPSPSTPSPSTPSPSTPSPSTPSTSTPSLGTLPSELSSLAWPARPRTTREVTVTSAAQLAAEAAVAGSRIHVRGATGGDVEVTANDVEIDADASSSLGVLSIAKSVSRVRVTGGRWGGVRVAIPAEFVPSPDYRPEWMAQDLHFEGMTIDSGGAVAFEIRGRRIALVDNDVTAGLYSVWCGDTDDFQTEDLILYDNVFRSAGPESTVRLVSVLRSAVVSNVMSNTYKHNYRIHGTSDLNYAADNLLVGSGVMFGTMPGDSLGRVWFDDNVFHQTQPDLFNPSPSALRTLVARRNLAHDDGHPTFYGGTVPSGWTLSENVIDAYTPPPAY